MIQVLSASVPTLVSCTLNTAWGWMTLSATPFGLFELHLQSPDHHSAGVSPPLVMSAQPFLTQAARELNEYLNGTRTVFTVPLDMNPATPFQRAVWDMTRRLPFGETRSYGWIARALGRPKSARAVGGALHINRLPLFIPCHRVVSTGGQLGGFAYGLEMKTRLLRHERSSPVLCG